MNYTNGCSIRSIIGEMEMSWRSRCIGIPTCSTLGRFSSRGLLLVAKLFKQARRGINRAWAADNALTGNKSIWCHWDAAHWGGTQKALLIWYRVVTMQTCREPQKLKMQSHSFAAGMTARDNKKSSLFADKNSLSITAATRVKKKNTIQARSCESVVWIYPCWSMCKAWNRA